MTIIKRLGLVGALSSTLALGAGCSTFDAARGKNTQTWTMRTGDEIPSAQGKVQVATEKDGNKEVRVEVKHLAQPERVFEGSSTYVVWLKAENGAFQNVGSLQVDKDLNGKLTTKTPFTSFDVMVTAEASAGATTPSSHSVMNAKVEVAS